MGWLDKLACLSNNKCDVNDLKFTPLPSIKVGDHLPMLIEFTVPQEQRKLSYKKNHHLKVAKR